MPQLRPHLRHRAGQLRRVIRQLEHHEVHREERRHRLRLFCADWQDPRNVGAAFRLADAAGLAGLVLAGATPRPPNRKIDKTARSTVRSVRFTRADDAVAALQTLRQEGALLLALELTDAGSSLLDYQLPPTAAAGDQDIILVPGSEAAGVSQELLDLCHGAVHLPMYGQNTSMNVAVATGAAVYLLLRQLRPS